MQNKNAEQVDQNIIKQVLPYLMMVVLFGIFVSLLFKSKQGVFSILLGATFSAFALRQLAEDQYYILIKGQRRRVFMSFIFRLFIFSIPIILSLKFQNYFKIWITLLFLFSSHIIFIISELIINYMKFKQRMKDDG